MRRIINRLFFLYHYARQNGILITIVRVNQAFKARNENFYIRNYASWFTQNNLEEIPDRSNRLFKKASILIVGVTDLPQCRKYRLFQKIELLSKLGFHCSYSDYQDTPRVLNRLQFSTHLLMYRVTDREPITTYVKQARKLGVTVCYDIDDPIFSKRVYSNNRNLDSLSGNEKSLLLDSCDEYLNVMRQCEIHFTSTPGMQELELELGLDNVTVWPNVIDSESMAIVNQLLEQKKLIKQKNSDVILGYMSGSRAHDMDFEIAMQALSKILEKFPFVKLVLGGYFILPSALAPYADRIIQLPFNSYHGYYQNIASIDINIVPLEQSEFNHCKSAIRYLEASLVKVPTIASAVGDFVNVISDRENGYLAVTEADWLQAIELLLENSPLRRTIAEKAFNNVITNHSIKTLETDLKQILSEKFKLVS